MADNYIERQYDDYLRDKAKKEERKRREWQKKLKAYKQKLADLEKEAEGGND